MEQDLSKNVFGGIEISLSEDATKAYVTLKTKDHGYTRDDIVRLLADTGVTTGIIDSALDTLMANGQAGMPVCVAQCDLPVDGKDGWFEFLFETNINTKPKILQDGSVDYSAYGNVPSVEEGQKIAIYHPATDCTDGVNFRGETIVAKKGKELARLKGKGFYVSDNGREYFAKNSGRASYTNDRLLVENELVIEGDVSLSTGDVNFSNDIHVRGNVLSGTVVASAKGSIVVDGYVESCQLYAGKDVVLKNGMQGNGKGKIISGGSVSGKFFEQVTIEAKEDVHANAIMNSNITARQDIEVSGKFGIIIGGSLSAERSISATIIGNMSETRTHIKVGVDKDLFIELAKTEKELKTFESELEKIVNGMEQIEQLEEQVDSAQKEVLQKKKVTLIRAKVARETQINEKMHEKQTIMEQMARANEAKIKAQKMIYPGTFVQVNGVKAPITEELLQPEITVKGNVLEIK